MKRKYHDVVMRRDSKTVPEPTRGIVWIFWGILGLESLIMQISELPVSLEFMTIGFHDQGSVLTTDFLLDQGMIPAVDFGYPYGALQLLIGRAWFGILGRNPYVMQVFYVLCNLGMTLGLARFATRCALPWTALAFLFATLPFCLLTNYSNLTHALEALLVCHAATEHFRGRSDRSLWLLTICLFVKPAMAYVFGLYIVVSLLYSAWRAGKLRVGSTWRPIIVASIVACGLLLVSVLSFGVASVGLLFPFNVAKVYETLELGITSNQFWLLVSPPNANLGFYFGTAGLFLVTGSVCLFAAWLWAIGRSCLSKRLPSLDRNANSFTVMHLAAILVFFTNSFSWTNYAFLMVQGLAVSYSLLRWRIILLMLGILAVLGQKAKLTTVWSTWQNAERSPVTANLWATESERNEFQALIDATKGKSTTLLTACGAGELLCSNFRPPTSLYLCQGAPLPTEIDLRIKAIRESDAVAVSISPMFLNIENFPRIAQELEKFDKSIMGMRFELYVRKVQRDTLE